MEVLGLSIEIKEEGNMREILLTREYITLVDDEDFERINLYKWHTVKCKCTQYAAHSFKQNGKPNILIYLHRFIMNMDDTDFHIDHIDHNGLNNQKSNLRICTRIQNNSNRSKQKGTSKYKGVYWDKNINKWRSKISVNKKRIDLGFSDSEVELAIAYNEAALKYHGEFAYLNIIV